MAQELSEDQELQRLIRQAEAARVSLKRDVTQLKAKLDVRSRIRKSLRIHPSVWLVGSLFTGFATSLVFRRSPKEKKLGRRRRGLLATLLGLALTAGRPLAKVWVSKQLKGYISGQSGGFIPRRLLQRQPVPQPPL